MNNDTYDMLTTLTPPDCLYFRAKVDGDGTIKSIEGNSIDDEEDLISVASNLILNTVLIRCYGIDMASVVEDFVDSTVNRITDLSNVFKACDWENAVIKDNSTSPATDVPVLRYIRQKFSIKTSDAFVDTIYQKLTNAVLGMQMDSKKSYVHCHLDGDTNLMINVLAVVIAYNDDFMNITIESTEVTYTVDPTNFTSMEDNLALAFKLKGYLADTIDKIYMSNAFKSLIDAEGNVNYNNYFPYMHVLAVKGYPGNPYENSVDTTNPKWCPVFYFTKEPVDDVFFEMETFTYGSRQGWIRWKPNFKKNGELITQGQEMMKIGANQTNWGYGAIGTLETCYYMNYNGQFLNNFEIKDRTDPQCTVRVKGYSQNYGDYANDKWSSTFFYNQNNDGQGNPKLEFEWLVWNNQFTAGDVLGIQKPLIDQTTEQNLEDNNIGLVCTGGESLDVYFTYANVNPALKPTDAPFDTRSTLKVGTVDPTLGVLLNDPNTHTTEFTTKGLADWSELWLNDITIKYVKQHSEKLGMGLAYHMDSELLKTLVADLWDDTIIGAIKKVFQDPYDSVLFLKEFPYDFIEGTDYWIPSQITGTEMADSFFYEDGTVPIVYGKDIRNTTARGHAISGSIHEIDFVLRDNPATNEEHVHLHNNFTDYEPYTHTTIYLPFVGTRDIPPQLIMREDLLVKYRISNITGDFVVYVVSLNNYASDGTTNGELPVDEQTYKMGAPILIETGNLALDRVVSGKNADIRGVISGISSAISSSMGGYTKAVQMLSSGGNHSSTGHSSGRSHSESDFTHNRNSIMNGSSISDVFNEGDTSSQTAYTDRGHSTTSSHNTNINYGGIAQGAIQAGVSLLAGSPVNHSNFVGNDGRWLGGRVPYITMIYNPPISDMRYDSAFNRTVGFASCQSIKIDDMQPDYHELMSVKLDGIKCTNEERQTIREILMSGFYNGTKPVDSHQPLRP